MTDLITLSASKLKTFTSCSRKYWYTYVQKYEQEKHPAAILGTAVHKTIQNVYENMDKAPLATNIFSDIYGNALREEGISPDIKLYKDGYDMVNSYKFSPDNVPIFMELEFTLPFPSNNHPMCNVTGFIDQVYPTCFKDLKTNRQKPLRGVLDNDLQFIIYAWAFKELIGYHPDLALWHHLRTGEELNADVIGNNKMELAIRTVDELLEAQCFENYNRRVGDSCRFCSYRLDCLGRAD